MEGSTYNGVGWTLLESHAEGITRNSYPLWEPNGVIPAGSDTPSGCRFRLVLAKGMEEQTRMDKRWV